MPGLWHCCLSTDTVESTQHDLKGGVSKMHEHKMHSQPILQIEASV